MARLLGLGTAQPSCWDGPGVGHAAVTTSPARPELIAQLTSSGRIPQPLLKGGMSENVA